MKQLKYILFIFAISCGIMVNADEAKSLFDNNEYIKAAKLYRYGANEALKSEDFCTYLENLLYEGECYYKLNLASDLAKSVETVKNACENHINDVSDLERRLLIEEGLYKLEGSYNTMMYLTDNSRFEQAVKSYQYADSIINMLDSIGHDEPSLRVDLYRDEANLYYEAKDFGTALDRCNVVCDFYNENGMFDISDSPLLWRYYDLTVDAFRSRAIIKARLKDFEGAIADIKLFKNYRSVKTLQRTLGKILMMRYDVTGLDTRAEAKKCYEAFIRSFKSDLISNFSSMTESQREQYWLSMHDFLFDCYRLEDYAPEMLYDLALFSKGYMTDNTLKYRWQDVRKKLTADACAIEFVQYNGKDDAKQLGALVLTSRSAKPKFIHIADVHELESLPLGGGIHVGEAIRNDYPVWKDELYSDSIIGSKIWTDELMELIGSVHKVYFAPDGLLHVLAVEYLMPDTLKECHRLSSTRTIIVQPKNDFRRVLACGDIDYSSPVVDDARGWNDESAYRNLSDYGSFFQNLSGTATEIDSIGADFDNKRNRFDITVLRGSEATDTKFLKAAKEADIVHLATHGFFTGTIQGSDLVPAISDCSLSESGLAMAGVNANLLDYGFDATKCDGILTAKELSWQKLGNVKMIILSACQTGLGYVTDDGVYGLQRGLKASGVGAMALSLWSVDDLATCELMRRFYKELVSQASNPDIYKAFMSARTSLIKSAVVKTRKFSSGKLALQQKSYRFNKPQYTNAFILIDVL